MKNVRGDVLLAASGHRHAIVAPAQLAPQAFADLAVFNAGVPLGGNEGGGWTTAAGGAAWDRRGAQIAAVAEALERYCAFACNPPTTPRSAVAGRRLDTEDFSLFSPQQRADARFPHAHLYDDDAQEYIAMTDAWDAGRVWMPAALATFRHAAGLSPLTSSGLAAGPSPLAATLAAIEEVIERDALMSVWLHGLRGRRVDGAAAATVADAVAKRGGTLDIYDITPDYSTHPVAVAVGGLPLRGTMRYSLGAACRRSWKSAVKKAVLEWAQGTTFAGVYAAEHQTLGFRNPGDVRTFDDHAVYYTLHPERWRRVPLLNSATAAAPPDAATGSRREVLRRLVGSLHDAGIDVLWRELTTVDLRQAGLSVVRAASPQLTPIHCDERWPHLGGRTPDVAWRYPGSVGATTFPSPHPHPLG